MRTTPHCSKLIPNREKEIPPHEKKARGHFKPIIFSIYSKTNSEGQSSKNIIYHKQNELEAVCKHRRFLESVGMTINKRGIIYLRNWMNTMQNK